MIQSKHSTHKNRIDKTKFRRFYSDPVVRIRSDTWYRTASS